MSSRIRGSTAVTRKSRHSLHGAVAGLLEYVIKTLFTEGD